MMPDSRRPAAFSRPSADAEGQPRIASIDALRGLAALAVVLLHFTTDFNKFYHPAKPMPFEFPWGAYGVSLFFTISGFVIFMTMERAAGVAGFMWSRFCRLFPAYWLAATLALLLLLSGWIPGAPSPESLLRRYVVNLFMVENWVGVAALDGVYWTLHVEMSFYVLMATLIGVNRRQWAIPVMAGVVLFSVVDLLLFPGQGSESHRIVRLAFMVGYAPAFLAGMMIYRGIKSPSRALFFCILLMPAVNLVSMPNHPARLADFAAEMLCVMLVYAAAHGYLRILECRPLLFLGAISYSLYLTHHWLGTVILLAMDRFQVSPWVGLLSALSVCVVTAAAVTFYWERPWNSFLRRHGAKGSLSIIFRVKAAPPV